MLGDKSDVTEDDLKEMVYLEQVSLDIYTCNRPTFQVISEGLRCMSLPSTSRFCTETYKIPDSDFTVPKGMKVIIPSVSDKEIDSKNVLHISEPGRLTF